MTAIKYLIVLAGIVFLIRGCIEWIDPAKVGSDLEGNWITVETLRSEGNWTTQVYDAPYGKSRVRWAADNPGDRMGMFAAKAKRSNGSVVKDISDVTLAGGEHKSGRCAINDAPKFHVEVHATGPWEMTVEVLR